MVHVVWVDLAQDRVRWWDLLNAVTHLVDLSSAGKFEIVGRLPREAWTSRHTAAPPKRTPVRSISPLTL
jgi:hypothetical protein